MRPHFARAFPGGFYVLIAAMAALGGCASIPSGSCEQFDQHRRALRYDTVYRYSDGDTRHAATSFAPVRRAEPVAVRWYTLRTNRTDIRPCDHLYLTKDVYLLHGAGAAVRLHELREFYTADGKLIASKREDVTRQLRTSGFYTASVPLPIPKEAPAGAYRIVTLLIATVPSEADRTLATTSAEFRVHP